MEKNEEDCDISQACSLEKRKRQMRCKKKMN